MNLEKDLRKEIQKNRKRKGGDSRPRPHFWPTGRSRPNPPALAPFPVLVPVPCPRADGRAVPPWRAGRARPPRGEHAAAWTCPGRPPGAPDRVRLRPRCQTRPSALALALSFARAQQQPLCRAPSPPTLGSPLFASSGLLPPLHDHRRLRLVLPHPVLTLNRVWCVSRVW